MSSMVGSALARLAVAVAPPALAAGAWWPAVAERPVIASVILLGYLVLVSPAVFAGRVVGDLARRWQARLVDRADRAAGRQLSRFDRRYRESVLGSLRYIDLKGLATVGFYTPELNEVFVDMSLTFRAPHDVPSDVVGQVPTDVTDRHSIWDFLCRSDPVVLALVGGPGSGKTTLLRHTAQQICRTRRSRQRNVPILLYVRDHVRAIVAAPDIGLPQLIGTTLAPSHKEPDGWFEQRLHDGDCVVLLDGLDELGRQEDHKQVVDWVDRQVRQYPQNDYVITCRPQGYLAAPVEGAIVLQVRGFTADQMARFVYGWYLAVEQRSGGDSEASAQEQAKSAASHLLDRLNDAPGLHDLTTNPLLLTMIANVHRHRGALPDSRARLYGEICQALLWRRQEAKRLPVNLGGDGKEVLLRGLAFTMMKRKVRDLPRTAVLAEIRPVLRRMDKDMNVQAFLSDVSCDGLLIERENGVFSFAHHTFQEYLAAAHIKDKGVAAVLADTVDDTWWREVTLLYCSGSDLDPIVSACLASGTVTALSLAFDCVQLGGGQLDPLLRDQLDELLRSAFALPAHPERRRLIADVLVARHFRHLVRAGDGVRICIRPISKAIYWLYLQDTGGPAPDNASREDVPPDDADMNEPITGVRGSDAAAFVRWVNVLTGNEPGYRLPCCKEVEHPSLQRALAAPGYDIPSRSIWCQSDNAIDGLELWTPAGTSHPHVVSAETVVEQIHRDVDGARPTFVRLLLLRATAAARILAHRIDLGHAHDLDELLDQSFDLARTVDHVRAIDQHFDIDRIRNHVADLNLALSHERSSAGRIVSGLVDELSRAVRRTDHAIVAPALTVDLAEALDKPSTTNVSFNDALYHIMGTALSQTLARVLRHTPSSSNWHAQFARLFVEQTGAGRTAHLMSPDMLTDKVQESCGAVTGIRTRNSVPQVQPWAHNVARRLADAALPIVLRQEPLDDAAATALRLAANCLAAEADANAETQLGNTFRDICAGITLLQQRRAGQSIPTEAIILATG
jgi:hypothetical protein